MPLAGRDVAALGVGEHGLVLGTEEVGDRVAVLVGVEGHNTVDAGLHGVVGGEPEGITDVHDGAALLGGDEAELLGSGRADLEAPLVAEEEGKRRNVGVLLVADVLEVLSCGIGGDVVHHGKGAGRGPVVAVHVLVPLGPGPAGAGGEGREDGLGNNVGARDGVLEDLELLAVLEDCGELGVVALDLVSGDLKKPRLVSGRGRPQSMSGEKLTLIIS